MTHGRLFDLRSLEHSTIIYETGQGTDVQKPLLRLAWNKSDPNFIATVPLDSDEVNHSYHPPAGLHFQTTSRFTFINHQLVSSTSPS